MTFTSIYFIMFICIVSLIYFLVPKKYRWMVLLAASYLFYWLNSHLLLLIMFASTVVTWLTGHIISICVCKAETEAEAHKDEWSKKDKKAFLNENKKKRKMILIVGVILILGILLFLKYYNFFASSINSVFTFSGSLIPTLHLMLPIGISFYTLQAIAYMVDVYRGKTRADNNLMQFMLFMSFFPQIVQGPIPRHSQLADQLFLGHEFNYGRLCHGIQLIIWGFAKKLIIAERIAIPVSEIFQNYTDYYGIMTFLALAGYGLQVYADFSGGMDIARGVSEVLGIELELNFRQPYFSRSVEDFWRRWHITLGAFMRDYVFYPLSLSKGFAKIGKVSRKIFGNYVGKRIPPFISMFLVYLLVGIWHGAELRFLVYGMWNGIFIATSILLTDVYNRMKKKAHIQEESGSWILFQIVRTFIIISFGRTFSNGINTKAALYMMKSVLNKWYDISFIMDGSLKKLGLDTANWILLFIFIGILLAVDVLHEKKIQIRQTIDRQGIVFRWVVYLLAFFAVLVFGIYGAGLGEGRFIYEQF